MLKSRRCCDALLLVALFVGLPLRAQTFRLVTVSDSLHLVALGDSSRWALPHPVYQFQVGDVNGDGIDEALVGVVKPSRFHRETAADGHRADELQRRLFVFKNYRGRVRPLWLGSRLGGVLQDFRFRDGRLYTLELTAPDLYGVGEYVWNKFGFALQRYVVKGVARSQAVDALCRQPKTLQYEKSPVDSVRPPAHGSGPGTDENQH